LTSGYHLSRKYDDIMTNNNDPERKYNDSSELDKVVFGGVEINTACNLNCPMCSTSLSERKNQEMDIELFKKIILSLKLEGVNSIHLHTIAEPLMNKNIGAYLEICKLNDIKVGLITNGLLISKRFDVLKCYEKNTISYLGLSVDGADKDTYELLRPPGKFDDLLINLELLSKFDIPKKLYSVVSKETMNQLGYHLQFYSKYFPMQDIHLNFLDALTADPDNKFFNDSALLNNHMKSMVPCNDVLGNHVVFQSNGNITACTRDYSDDLVYGNIDEVQDGYLKYVISNKRLNIFKKNHINDNIGDGHLCSNCYSIDSRVSMLFTLFYRTLVMRYHDKWKVEEIQNKFDLFFEAFSSDIPNKQKFISLL